VPAHNHPSSLIVFSLSPKPAVHTASRFELEFPGIISLPPDLGWMQTLV